jgi:Acyl-CoA dehydrogenase, C-terminal domain
MFQAIKRRMVDLPSFPVRSIYGRSWRTMPGRVPRRYGGYQAGVRTSLEVMAALAHGDGAAGWVASLVNHSARDIGLFPTRVRPCPRAPPSQSREACVSPAAGQVVEAIDILLDVHGSGGLVDASPLQRIWQDASVAARHVSLLPGMSYEVYGKALLGLLNDVVLSL